MWQALVKFLLGDPFNRLLDTVDKRFDNATERERIKAQLAEAQILAQASVLGRRTWWFQLFFVVPLGVWFSLVVADSIFYFPWNVAALPSPLDEWAGWIVSSLFLVNGVKEVLRK